jgi:PleD family two-component response regulator
MMNGEITAESQGHGHGATFHISFSVISSNATDSPPREDPFVTINVPPQNILLVEDNKSTALVMTRFLKKLGHEVKTAYSIKEGISQKILRKFKLFSIGCCSVI